jgi:hypothetical protein
VSTYTGEYALEKAVGDELIIEGFNNYMSLIRDDKEIIDFKHAVASQP